jgi:hypothetical protein
VSEDSADPMATTNVVTPPGARGGGDATDTVDDLSSQPGADDLVAGRRLGRYKLLGKIGGGAMGVVWRARDPNLDRDVAIKVVHPSLARIPDAAARLMREARALAKVSHSAVVAVHDAAVEDGQLYVAMELVEGITLGTIIKKRIPRELRDWRRTLALVTEAGQGLAAAHTAGVLHRDFKPENVLVSNGGRVAVADFGLAEIVAAAASAPRQSATALSDSWQVDSVDSLTMTGAVVGTPAYMSPEQLRSGVVDARSDQFGFCVTAYEALYGRRPFDVKPAPDQPPAVALLQEIEAGNIRAAPRETTVPRWLRDVIVRGLAPEPEKRWPDMRTLVDALAPPRRIGLAIAAGAVAAVGIAVAVWALLPEHARVLTPRRLFPLPMSQRIESSSDGQRIAYADDDRIYIRDLDPAVPPRELSFGGSIDHIEFEKPDVIVASVRTKAGFGLRRWYVASGVTEDLDQFPGWGQWYGAVGGGNVLSRVSANLFEVAIVKAGQVEVVVSTPRKVATLEIAPGGKRIAYVLEDGFQGHVAVYDVARRRTITTPTIPEPTGLAWIGDDELLYSTGMGEGPAMWRVSVGADAIGAPARLWGKETGWFGYLAVTGDDVQYVDSQTSFMARWVDRVDPAASRELDPASVAAGLGWDDEGRPLGWQRVSGKIVRLRVSESRIESEPTPAALDGDIGNATRAGDIEIVALRRRGAREVVALSLTDGRRLWARAPGDGLLVRCAGDAREPCFLARVTDGEARIDQINPATGLLLARLPAPASISDLAVSPDGSELLVADGGPHILRVDLTSPSPVLVPYLSAPIATIRGLVHDPKGGVLVTGTRKTQLYQLVHVGPDGDDIVAQSSNDLLSVPRPSPSGDQVLVLTRRYLPVLHLLPSAL